MNPRWVLVSEELREGMLEALRSDDYFIFPSGRRYLEILGFDPPEFVVQHLIEYFEAGSRIYVLPDNPAKAQCCLCYEDDLIVHVKLTPKPSGWGYFVKLDFHRHNTGYQQLPP